MRGVSARINIQNAGLRIHQRFGTDRFAEIRAALITAIAETTSYDPSLITLTHIDTETKVTVTWAILDASDTAGLKSVLEGDNIAADLTTNIQKQPGLEALTADAPSTPMDLTILGNHCVHYKHFSGVD